MSHGHSPRDVGWFWPMPMLLNFLHAELRKQGVRTYKRQARPQITESTLADNLATFRADLDGWEM